MNMTPLFIAQNRKNSWITIGTFDGVHLGHQALIRQLVDQAHFKKSPAFVITFWPHPAVFFKRAPVANALSTSEERSSLIKSLGVDEVITLDFTQELADLDAKDFMLQLKERLNICHLITGPNFALGKSRTGSSIKLVEIGKMLGFEVEQANPQSRNNVLISSSQIRQDLIHSRIQEANQKLGRKYSLQGKVVHGEHRGTGLGIPTANLEIPIERLVPGNGVYVTKANIDGRKYTAVTNIGIRPTFDNPLLVPRIEPHILDLQEQLYDKSMTLEFVDFLRPEVKFEDSESLVAQIQKDIAIAREVMKDEK